VNGPKEAPLYTYLKAQKGGWVGRDIGWNFAKFLVRAAVTRTAVLSWVPGTRVEQGWWLAGRLARHFTTHV